MVKSIFRPNEFDEHFILKVRIGLLNYRNHAVGSWTSIQPNSRNGGMKKSRVHQYEQSRNKDVMTCPMCNDNEQTKF